MLDFCAALCVATTGPLGNPGCHPNGLLDKGTCKIALAKALCQNSHGIVAVLVVVVFECDM